MISSMLSYAMVVTTLAVGAVVLLTGMGLV